MKINYLQLIVGLMAAILLSCAEDPKQNTQATETVAKAPSSQDQALLAELTDIAPASGMQLPAPGTDFSNWKPVSISQATILVPPDWKPITDFGEKPGGHIHTIGAVNAKEDLYVELRVLEDSDSSYMQGAMDHVKFDYKLSKDRYAELTTLGFKPMVKDGVAGKVEIMNEYGKAKNEDGSPTWRIILWDGRWQQGDRINKAEITARFAQDNYEQFAPMVSSIISTVAIKR